MPRRKTKVRKREMVRQAMEAGAVMPTEGVDWIQEHFNVRMKPNNFSNFKTILTRGPESSVAKQPKAPSGPASSVARKPPAQATTGGDENGIRLDELLTLRNLVDRVGADGIAQAVNLLTR